MWFQTAATRSSQNNLGSKAHLFEVVHTASLRNVLKNVPGTRMPKFLGARDAVPQVALGSLGFLSLFFDNILFCRGGEAASNAMKRPPNLLHETSNKHRSAAS